MQRLGDIVAKDLAYIMNVFMDFTKEVTIQCGAIKHTLNASLQADDIQFTSDVSPINAFSIDLYFIETDDDDFNRALKKNAIIIVNGTSYRIIDAALVQGLRVLSLEKHGGR